MGSNKRGGLRVILCKKLWTKTDVRGALNTCCTY